MRALLALGLALACATTAAAQSISISVTHTESRFDIRAVDPAGTAYALNLSRGSSEIWASTDDARTWTFRGRHPLGYGFKTMTALSDGTLLADVQTGSTFFLARSTDHGVTWTNVLSLGGYRLLTPHNLDEAGGTVFFAEYQSFTGGTVPVRIRASTDRGATWSTRFTFSSARHAHGIRAAPDGSLWVFLGDVDAAAGTWRSTDGGFTWRQVLSGQEGRIVDAVFVGPDALFGQDVPVLPERPSVARATPTGTLTKFRTLPGPSYSIHRVGTGFLLGTTREPVGDVYAPGDVSAHLLGSADGVTWTDLGAYPRIDDTDYARADVYWVLRTGEAVLNLRHVQTLSGGRGYQLLRVSTSTTPPPPPSGTSFSDNFDACTSEVDLGAAWAITGRWYCRVGRARGETGGGTALVRTSLPADQQVSSLVQLNGTASASGVVARAAAGHLYAARLLRDRLQLVRIDNGLDTVLGSVARTFAVDTSYTVGLRVTGTSPVELVATLSGSPVLSATDASPERLVSGSVGLLSGAGAAGTFFRTQYDTFTASGSGSTTPPPPPPPPSGSAFADDFDACTSDVDLGPDWAITGRWYCRVGRARGETGGGTALVRQAVPADQLVTSLVQLNGTASGSGVIARASGGRFYAARLQRDRLELVRVDGASVTVLASVARTFAVDTSYTVSLRVTGSSTVLLAASINGAAALSATDISSARLTSGAAGLLSGGGTAGTFFRTQYDTFRVAAP